MRPDQPKIAEAKALGQEAGRLSLAASLNPYPEDSIEATTWETERLLVIGRRTIARLEEIQRRFL